MWLCKRKERGGKYARWAVFLEDFDYTIEHVAGKSNVVADALSRVSEPITGGSLDSSPDSASEALIISSAVLTPCSLDRTELALHQHADPYSSRIIKV